ncbi:MAG: glycosyltransferase [Candidatus Margulisiibacteriota bacterium]
MRALIDLVVINISAVAAFFLREHFGDFLVKEHPSLYLDKYLLVLLLFNLTFPCIFWLLGLYDRRQKRALLEEFLLIFGVFSVSLSVLIIFLFLGRLWWMSRVILFVFWGLSVVLLAAVRLVGRDASRGRRVLRYDPADLRGAMEQSKRRLENDLRSGLSIVIVTYNSAGKIENCLESLKKADLKMPHEIIVVDNHSSDSALAWLKNRPAVKLINNPDNLGYSRAVNLGIKAAAHERLLILNPDIIVIPGAIELLLDYLQKNPKVGLAGCRLLNEDGTLQYSVRRFLDLRTYLYRFTPLRGLMAGSAIERYYLMQDWDHGGDRLVDWVLGGCMMARKEALQAVGLMGEQYFLYFEDVDLCFRLWEKGWQVAYVGEAAMFHRHERASANRLFTRATREHFKSLCAFLRAHGLRLPVNAPSSRE